MKRYWFLIIGSFLIIGGIIYISINHRRWIRKLYLNLITKNLAYNSVQLNGSLNYRLYVPKNVNSEKLPLILYLHGGGQKGSDNRKQLDFIFNGFSSSVNQKKYPSYVLAPQCPPGKEWVNRANKNVPFTHYLQDETDESLEMQLIIELIKNVFNQYPIDADRIYVCGFSMGGTGAWDILTRYPNVFAGAAILSGVSDTTKAHFISHIPIWAFSGENDSIAPAILNENMCKTINAYKGNCKFTKFENIGHDCVSTTFEHTDLIKWLFSQKKENRYK